MILFESLFRHRTSNLFYKWHKQIVSSNFATKSSERKIFKNVNEAVKDIKDGSTILVGGFFLCGLPVKLLGALSTHPASKYTIACNTATLDDYGLGPLMKQKKIKRMISSWIGENAEIVRQYLSGEIELELTPQGTIAEKLRAGGAGIPAFFTPTAVGTVFEKGGYPIAYDSKGKVRIASKPRRVQNFNGKDYIMEEAITGDYALIRALKADPYGNLIFNKSARNFNLPMAKAAKITIAEVEEIVKVGDLKPDEIHLPGIFVNRIVKVGKYTSWLQVPAIIEKVIAREAASPESIAIRGRIARRAALEFKDGMYVNLGIGIPVLASNYLPKDMVVIIQSENGILGLGAFPTSETLDPDVTNAGHEPSTVIPGASFFGSDESFGIIRGGHLDMTMLGAMQVSKFGDLANWMIPKQLIIGMGGAMDLVSAPGTKVIVCMEHVAKNGKFKILNECSLPLTGKQCVSLIITEKAVFEVDFTKGLTLTEYAEGVKVDDIKKSTGCDFTVSPGLKQMGQIDVPE